MKNNRRVFLRNSALLTLGLDASGLSANGWADPEKKKVIGHNDFTYELDKDWAVQDPNKFPVRHCHEMVMDEDGQFYLSTTERKNNLLVFNKDGKVIKSWTHELPEPHGLTIAGEGSDQSLWLTDSVDGRVLNIDLNGRLIRELKVPADIIPKGQAFKPTETAVAPNGNIYVADGYGSNLILQYDCRGKFKTSFGGPDHFDCAHGIALDTRTDAPTLLITSRAANNFQRWSLDGKLIMKRELPGLSICRPVIRGAYTYFAVIVTQSWWHYDGMVAVLDEDFNVVSLPGGSAPVDQQHFKDIKHDGFSFLNPHDVCLDEDENIYVPQWYSGRTYPVRLRRV